jgi:methionyl-tRNA formyltransferase
MEPEHTENFSTRPRIVFMGTPDFSLPCLKALVDRGHEVLAVVTQPDRPKGRGRKVVSSPVKRAAEKYGLRVLQPEKASDEQFCQVIRSLTPDLLVVVAFGQILKKGLLETSRLGAVNIHASLLPRYRGAAPIHWAILNDEAKTGLTAMVMDEGLDTGPILLQREVPIGREETAGELHDRLSVLAGDLLLEAIEGLADNRLREEPQDNSRATYAPKIERRMSLIKWAQPARAISAHIRALDPWPGAFTMLAGKEIKLFSSRVTDEDRNDVVPGRVSGHLRGALQVETSRGVLEVRELQVPGKKRLIASDFLRGFPVNTGTVLGE